METVFAKMKRVAERCPNLSEWRQTSQMCFIANNVDQHYETRVTPQFHEVSMKRAFKGRREELKVNTTNEQRIRTSKVNQRLEQADVLQVKQLDVLTKYELSRKRDILLVTDADTFKRMVQNFSLKETEALVREQCKILIDRHGWKARGKDVFVYKAQKTKADWVKAYLGVQRKMKCNGGSRLCQHTRAMHCIVFKVKDNRRQKYCFFYFIFSTLQ